MKREMTPNIIFSFQMAIEFLAPIPPVSSGLFRSGAVWEPPICNCEAGPVGGGDRNRCTVHRGPPGSTV